jgi:hypothetical protein
MPAASFGWPSSAARNAFIAKRSSRFASAHHDRFERGGNEIWRLARRLIGEPHRDRAIMLSPLRDGP